MSGRIRTIKPEWLEDEVLASASDEARVLSVALILMADDHGRGRASVASIASGAWRYQLERDDGAHAPEILARSSRALRELVANRFVTLYQVSGQAYFEIRNWRKHQKVDRPGKPRVPAPDSRDSRETLASNSRDPREDTESGQEVPEPPAETSTEPPIASVSRDPREDVATDSRDPRETLATDLRPPTSDQGPPTVGARAGVHEDDPKRDAAKALARAVEAIRADLTERYKRVAEADPMFTTPSRDLAPFSKPIDELAKAFVGRKSAWDATVDGFFASPRAKAEGYPLAWLAKNPAQFAPKAGGASNGNSGASRPALDVTGRPTLTEHEAIAYERQKGRLLGTDDRAPQPWEARCLAAAVAKGWDPARDAELERGAA